MEDGGETFIEVRNNGEVEVHEGYRAYADTCSPAKVEEAGGAPQAARAELTKAAENYLALHRHAIVRAELLAHSGIACGSRSLI